MTGASAADATIIIPQHEHPELTCACIRSLRATDPHPWPVIVVDDGSSHKCRETVLAADWGNTLVLMQHRWGVSAAWNLGVTAARTPYLVFLNNDVLLTGPIIEPLIEPLRMGKALLSGVRTRRERTLPHHMLQSLPTDRFLEGWCFATSREHFQRVGGFDEAMSVYWADTDFQARLIATVPDREGIICVPNLPLRHLGHRTARILPNRRRIWQADRRAFLAKWNSP